MPKLRVVIFVTEKKIIAARERSLGQGNVFTPVCDSVHEGMVSAPLHAGIYTLGRHPLGRHLRHLPR